MIRKFPKYLRGLLLASVIAIVPVFPALASIMDTINSRGDLTQFRDLLNRTGTDTIINGGGFHTVFAPVNDAFGYWPNTQYPYFYAAYPGLADNATWIARNHVVNGIEYLPDLIKHNNKGNAFRSKGGVYAVNQRFIPVGEATTRDLTVDGHRVLSTHSVSDGILYIIDGVIAKPWETPVMVPVAAIPAP